MPRGVVLRVLAEETGHGPAVRHDLWPRLGKAGNIERLDKTEPRLVAADPLNSREELPCIGKVKQNFGIHRIVDSNIDKRTAARNITKPDWIAVVGVVDFTLP